MNIYQRMAAITEELQTVAKNLTVGTGNNKYKAVSERDVLDAVKPLEHKHGVYSYPAKRTVLESNLLENEKSYTDFKTKDTTVTKSTTFMTRIETVYRFVNIENPEDFVEMTTFAEGIDPQDKGSGKAMTYADKYALLKAYKISTGDDPDQTASEEVKYTAKGKSETPTFQQAKPKAKEQTPREKLIEKLKEKGINPAEYAKEKGLTTATTPERYLELLSELG